MVEAACAADGAQAEFKWFSTALEGASGVLYPFVGNGSFEWVGGPNPAGPNLFHRAECNMVNVRNQCAAPMVVQLGIGKLRACVQAHSI